MIQRSLSLQQLENPQTINSKAVLLSTPNSRLQRSMPPPPRWLQGWRHLVKTFMDAEAILLRVMLQACKMKIRSRKWLAFQDPMEMEEMLELWEKKDGPCQHTNVKRYGNRHGSYSRCLDCGKKWQWDPELQVWLDPKPPLRKHPIRPLQRLSASRTTSSSLSGAQRCPLPP